MLTALFVGSLTNDLFEIPYDILVGIDKGAVFCAENKLMMDMAVGDFDSIDPEDHALVKAYSKELVILNKQKNESDSEVAVARWVDRVDRIIMLGALGGRLDHQYVNMHLMMQHPTIHLRDHLNHMFVTDESIDIFKDGYTYLSLFALEESVVTLSNVKYPLNKRVLYPQDRYTLSNEFMDKVVRLTLDKGKLMIIKSKDK